MTIQTRPPTPEYEQGWDRIFGGKKAYPIVAGNILAENHRNCPQCDNQPLEFNGEQTPYQKNKKQFMLDTVQCHRCQQGFLRYSPETK